MVVLGATPLASVGGMAAVTASLVPVVALGGAGATASVTKVLVGAGMLVTTGGVALPKLHPASNQLKQQATKKHLKTVTSLCFQI